MWHIRGSKHTLTPPNIFSGGHDPNPQDLRPCLRSCMHMHFGTFRLILSLYLSFSLPSFLISLCVCMYFLSLHSIPSLLIFSAPFFFYSFLYVWRNALNSYSLFGHSQAVEHIPSETISIKISAVLQRYFCKQFCASQVKFSPRGVLHVYSLSFNSSSSVFQ